MYYDEHHCPRFDWTALQVVRTSLLGPRPRFYAALGKVSCCKQLLEHASVSHARYAIILENRGKLELAISN